MRENGNKREDKEIEGKRKEEKQIKERRNRRQREGGNADDKGWEEEGRERDK